MLRTKLPFFLAYAMANNQPIFIDYIESDGNQYIDTEQLISGGVTLEIVAQGLGDKGLVYSFDQDWQAASLLDRGSQWFANGIHFAGSSLDKTTIESSWSGVGRDYTNTVTINGETATYTRTGRSFSNLLLFVGKNYLVPDSFWKGRIYSSKLYKNNVLIQDLRPCIDPNGIVCMYDTVSKQYLYNQGTGSFIAGPRFIEYIKSTGTQYIDTGVYAPGITRFVVKGTCDTNYASNTQLLGTNNSSATTFFGGRYMSATGVKSWYCINAEGVSIGNPTDLSIIDCTIESRTSQYGTLIDLVNNTTSEFIRFASGEWGFTSSNLILFGGVFPRHSPNATCYSLQLYTANGLVRDLRPCLDGNNVKCMYDLVTGKYYYNQGTGEFE